jgi:hypothetical protein
MERERKLTTCLVQYVSSAVVGSVRTRARAVRGGANIHTQRKGERKARKTHTERKWGAENVNDTLGTKCIGSCRQCTYETRRRVFDLFSSGKVDVEAMMH